MVDKKELGSQTARGGFLSEAIACKKFLNYKNDKEASLWLETMGYELKNIQSLSAIQIPPRINMKKALALGVSEKKYQECMKYKKANIQIRIEILIDDILYIENLSLKKANKSAGFNQVDKRTVDTYQKMWNFDKKVSLLLKKFTGELLPSNFLHENQMKTIKDKRRIFLNEMSQDEIKIVIDFFEKNKTLVIFDILKGRGSLSAEWILVAKNIQNRRTDWVLKDINSVCNFYVQGDVRISPRGSLKIGRVTMQRKGGTPDPTSLQFKINPLELFELRNG